MRHLVLVSQFERILYFLSLICPTIRDPVCSVGIHCVYRWLILTLLLKLPGQTITMWSDNIMINYIHVNFVKHVTNSRNRHVHVSAGAGHDTNAAFQSRRAKRAHDFEVGKITVHPYVAFQWRIEPIWLIVLPCSVYCAYY